MAAAMGGRAAEELMFYEVTTGAGNDIEQATSIARSMITKLGMSKKLGPRTFRKREELVFRGGESRAMSFRTFWIVPLQLPRPVLKD